MIKNFLIFSVLILCLSAFAGEADRMLTSPRQWASAADAAFDNQDFALAAADFQKAIAGGYNSFGQMYKLACIYAIGNQPELAIDALQTSAALGLHDSDRLQHDSDLDSLRLDKRWPAILATVNKNAQNYHATHNDPNGFKFVTSDIDLFWKTYDQATVSSDPAGIWEHNYLDRGSPGLQGFVRMRIRSGADLDKTIKAFPKYYAAIRDNKMNLAAVEPMVRQSMRKFKIMYPDANFPDVYLVIGAFNSGGTATDDGLIMGSEVFSRGKGVPLDELDPWRRSVVKSVDSLPNIIAHELMHFQQNYDANGLLAKVIEEGSADFLASLISDGNFNQPIYDYGYAHEAELKLAFLQDLPDDKTGNWLYGGDKNKDRPADLGYFMGFRITQAYYQRADDKQQAVRDILNIKNFQQFLNKSGYFDRNAKAN